MSTFCVWFSYENARFVRASFGHGNLSAVFMSDITWPKAAHYARAIFFTKRKKKERKTKTKAGHSHCNLKSTYRLRRNRAEGVLYSVGLLK